MENLTPQEIVDHLDKYIVGQEDAKRTVAIALRNRYRRSKLSPELQEEIAPKNIIMIGPTGVGKTEIARRLAKLINAPFIKVEATKYTEVGYVGRDVESMIRDLVEVSINIVKQKKMVNVQQQAQELAQKKILDILVPDPQRRRYSRNPLEAIFGHNVPESDDAQDVEQKKEQRLIVQEKLKRSELEDDYIEIDVEEDNVAMANMFSNMGMDEMGISIDEMFSNLLPKKTKKRRVKIAQARKILAQAEAQKLIDMEEVKTEAIKRVENFGIIFLDEIDKIAGPSSTQGVDVSREGVQRDILPIVEGSTIITKYGNIRTDHILFIAAGAFHVAKPADLIPELQGRFPLRVELHSLKGQDLKKILQEPRNSLLEQYKQLLAIEGIDLRFTENAIDEIADIAYTVNSQAENIGARRLYTILEKVLEEISFTAASNPQKQIMVDQQYVQDRLDDIVSSQDLSRYIL